VSRSGRCSKPSSTANATPKSSQDSPWEPLRSKIPELVDALTGRFKRHHAFMARLHLDQIDSQTRIIDALTDRIGEAMTPFCAAREFLATIPGVSLKVADVIIAETGADMSRFENPGRLASWAGVCPGSNESAGRIKSAHILPGNKYLKRALGTAARAVSRSQTTYLGAKYRRIKSRRGPMKALVGVEHSILTAVWHLLTTGEVYRDPGPDYFAKLGYPVTLEPLTQTG
jgi:transposase